MGKNRCDLDPARSAAVFFRAEPFNTGEARYEGINTDSRCQDVDIELPMGFLTTRDLCSAVQPLRWQVYRAGGTVPVCCYAPFFTRHSRPLSAIQASPAYLASEDDTAGLCADIRPDISMTRTFQLHHCEPITVLFRFRELITSSGAAARLWMASTSRDRCYLTDPL